MHDPAVEEIGEPPSLDRSGRPRGPDRVHELVGDDPEEDRPAQDGRQLLPRPHVRDQRDQDCAVEEEPRVGRVAQELERDRDHDRPDHDARLAAGAAQDHHRVERDQERQVEVLREDAELDGGEDRSGEPCRGGAEHEREDLHPVDRDAHHLGRERVLAQRPPRPAGARLVQQVEADEHEREHDERQPEVALRRTELDPEDLHRVEARDPIRAAGEVRGRVVPGQRDPVRIRGQDDEDLREEQGDDREVVADQAPRRQAEHEPEQRRRDHHDHDRHLGGPVDAELLGRENRVGVGAEAVEGDVAEVEQAGVAHDDVEAERQQAEEDGVDRDADDVVRVGHERHERGQADDDRQARPRRHPVERADERCRPAGPQRRALALASHPLVDADPWAGLGCGRRLGCAGVVRPGHQTFWMSPRPSSPDGRTSRIAIRIEKTKKSWKVDET